MIASAMGELSKTYDPNSVEPKWYARWIEDGDFRADAKSAKPPFSIVIPPPNITGVLTLGHVLNNTVQDILARRARMLGFEVLWLPGTDHAGLATQTAVEKSLRANEKVSRHDLGREEFLRRTWEWREKHGRIIFEQLKRLGCSCDWSRERFTLDAAYVRAVQQVFVDLYEKKFIYRGRRMINWDPAALTALSDEEVIPTRQKSRLYFVKYEIVEEPGRFLEVATTRPETIMADTAVAVNPNDKRYRELIGKHAWRPLARAELPIVSDAAIDPEFGTGVLKVTPAHDKVDFEIGQRHQLPVIDVLHPDGRINCPNVPELDGLDRFLARQKAAELLTEVKLLAKEEPYENTVGFSERAGVPIEPRLSEQWFLRYPKTEEALAVVREHLIRFFPAHWEKVYEQWLANIQDWCISRQVWWGHRIPAWYNAAGESRIQIDSPGEGWTQDPDTLDTWFSSWLWAYETMDEETRAKFYPTSVLVTAPDIIFFWVARMIIAGLEFKPGKSDRVEDNIPFRDVYFTGLIRDKNGVKMSKSKGNSPDPIALIDQYGADAVRIGVVGTAPLGHDVIYDEKDIELGRNFCTKLWNAARLRMSLQGCVSTHVDTKLLTSFDSFILSLLQKVIIGVSDSFARYEFAGGWLQLSGFFWHDFCDWYLEAAKATLKSGKDRHDNVLAVMDACFATTLRLLHPCMPFVTAELWERMGYAEMTGQTSLMTAKWPTIEELEKLKLTAASEETARKIIGTVNQARTLRVASEIPSNKRMPFVLKLAHPLSPPDLDQLTTLLRADPLSVVMEYQQTGIPMALSPLGELYLVMSGGDKQAEADRLDKEIAKLEQELRTVNQKLANSSFVDKAPRAVVDEHQRRKSDFAAKLAQLRQARAALN